MNLFIAVLKFTFSKYGNNPLHRQVGKKKKRRSSLTMAFDFVKSAVSKASGAENPGELDKHLSMVAKRKSSVRFGGDDFLDEEKKDSKEYRATKRGNSMAASFASPSFASQASGASSGFLGTDGPKLDDDVTLEVREQNVMFVMHPCDTPM